MIADVAGINLAIGFTGMTICVLGLTQTVASSHMERRMRRYFMTFFFILIVYIAANLIGQFGNGGIYRKT